MTNRDVHHGTLNTSLDSDLLLCPNNLANMISLLHSDRLSYFSWMTPQHIAMIQRYLLFDKKFRIYYRTNVLEIDKYGNTEVYSIERSIENKKYPSTVTVTRRITRTFEWEEHTISVVEYEKTVQNTRERRPPVVSNGSLASIVYLLSDVLDFSTIYRKTYKIEIMFYDRIESSTVLLDTIDNNKIDNTTTLYLHKDVLYIFFADTFILYTYNLRKETRNIKKLSIIPIVYEILEINDMFLMLGNSRVSTVRDMYCFDTHNNDYIDLKDKNVTITHILKDGLEFKIDLNDIIHKIHSIAHNSKSILYLDGTLYFYWDESAIINMFSFIDKSRNRHKNAELYHNTFYSMYICNNPHIYGIYGHNKIIVLIYVDWDIGNIEIDTNKRDRPNLYVPRQYDLVNPSISTDPNFVHKQKRRNRRARGSNTCRKLAFTFLLYTLDLEKIGEHIWHLPVQSIIGINNDYDIENVVKNIDLIIAGE